MLFAKHLRQRAEIGGIAARVLTIPVMAAALVAAYLTLLSQTADEPAMMADVSAQWIATPEEFSLPLAARLGSPRWPEPVVADSFNASHEALDPSGAGRMSP